MRAGKFKVKILEVRFQVRAIFCLADGPILFLSHMGFLLGMSLERERDREIGNNNSREPSVFLFLHIKSPIIRN